MRVCRILPLPPPSPGPHRSLGLHFHHPPCLQRNELGEEEAGGQPEYESDLIRRFVFRIECAGHYISVGLKEGLKRGAEPCGGEEKK